ncbi:MAG: hypothetical protein HKN29_10285 [Rhodothermales bacterium]|nr:hypothetical protein [Rhodothermales bacterium]
MPQLIREAEDRWSLELGAPWDSPDVTASWVAPVRRSNGSQAVLKLGMPHFEAEHELEGLRFWSGSPTVHLLEGDEAANAMLLERCVPGTPLRTRPEVEQDEVLSEILPRMWRVPKPSTPFRHLSEMLDYWADETRAHSSTWPDAGMVTQGLRLFESLADSAPTEVLLATDLHAGNVLRAEREPWLAIDPKPFVGDPAYDATQHLFNCPTRMIGDPIETINRFADLLGLSRERVRLWTFARAAAEPRGEWDDFKWSLAHRLRP